MSIAHAIAQSGVRHVEIGGLVWRIEKVSNEALLANGASVVDFLDVQTKRDLVAQAKAAGAASEEQAKELINRKIADQLTEKNVARLTQSIADRDNAAVCAGVTGAGLDVEHIEALSIVSDPRKADPDNSILWVGALDAKTRDALAKAVIGLLSEDLGSRLARFQGAA